MEKMESVFEYKKCLWATLRKISLGESVVIKNTDFKVGLVRTAASNLKRREGFIFTVSDAGRIDDVVVTRLK